jgi:hypothetical protein
MSMNCIRIALWGVALGLTACGGGGGVPPSSTEGPAAPVPLVLDSSAQTAFLGSAASELIDDFERSDRPLHGDALPTTLLRWNVTGRGGSTASIVEGRLEATDQTFAYIDYEAPVTRIAAVFSFTSDPADDPALSPMGLIVDRRTANEGLQNILHLNFGPRSWTLRKGGFEAGSGVRGVTIASGIHSLLTDGARYGIAMEIRTGAVTVVAPNGGRITVTDPDVGVAPSGGGAGTSGPLQYAAFQITAAAGAPKGRWEAVSRSR